jgi:hypothetical protein
MPKTPLRQLSDRECIEVHALRAHSTMSQVEIATRLGIPQLTVSLILKGPVTPTRGIGRAPLLDTPTRQTLVGHATLNAEN